MGKEIKKPARLIKMKQSLRLIPLFIFALLSCKSLIQKKIVGKWRGTGIETLAQNGKGNKFIQETEFTTGGKVIETNFDVTGYPNAPVVYSYDIEGDSIIWINKIGNKMLTKSRIEFISDTRLLYKSVIGDILTTYDFSKLVK